MWCVVLLLEPLKLKSRTEVRVKTDQRLSYTAYPSIAKTLYSSTVFKLSPHLKKF